MNRILKRLAGGDLRSEGDAEMVAAEIVASPRLLADLVAGLRNGDKVVRGRTCMALEIISRDHPDLLIDVIPDLMDLAATDTVSQVRWHIAEVFGNVPLSGARSDRAISILMEYLGDKSNIVRYCAVQTLGALGKSNPRKREIINGIRPLKNESKGLAKAVPVALEGLEQDREV